MYNLQDVLSGNDFYKDLEKMRDSIENRNEDDGDYVERKVKLNINLLNSVLSPWVMHQII